MAAGLGGVALLVAPDLTGQTLGTNTLTGFLILQIGSVCWSLGSLLQRRQRCVAHPVAIGTIHQLAAGLAFLPPALLAPETPIAWSARGAGALVYLAIFGSIIGYSAYIYALDRLPVAVVSIYPYVNAVVAVTLGWIFYREPFGAREALAMTLIFSSVAAVKRAAST